jgi:periplasmic copper chaperone A
MYRKSIASLLLLCVFVTLSGCAAKRLLAATNAFSYACVAGDDCAVFMTIANPNRQADTLLAARSDAAQRVELHKLIRDAQGNMKMQQVANIPLPPARTVELKPGSLHMMMVGLTKDLKAGDSFRVVLEYEKAGKQAVEVLVWPKN